MSRTLLLISRRPEDQAFAQAVAVTAEMSLRVVAEPREAAALIAQEDISAILADTSTAEQYQALEVAIQEAVGLFSDRINANAFHFLRSDDLEKVQYLVQSPLFGHFILRNYGDPAAAGENYGRVVRATLAERAFGLAGLIRDGTKVQVVKLSNSNQTQQAVEAVKNYLIAAKFQTRLATVVANAVDELLMNAIFDAPIDSLGKAILSATPRSTPIDLAHQHEVEMHVAYDGKYVAVTACDLFGSLDKVKLMSHISKIYTEEEYKVRTSVAGAGIGLATVFRSGGSFFFVSESRVRTEVTVFFQRTDNFREFKDQFRFISTQFYF